MRVAIVQEYLTQDGGAEVVFEELARMRPDADLFAFFVAPDRKILGRPVHQTSWASLARRLSNYRVLFPAFPRMARSLDFRAYDLVVSSSFGLAKAVRLGKGQTHVCYCHTPPRWLYDMSTEYLATLDGGIRRKLAKWLFGPLRRADLAGAKRVDVFVANSAFVAERIQRTYGRASIVVHPPVHVGRFRTDRPRQGYYFTLSRLVPYKRIDFLVEAFRSMPDRELVVGGGGPDLERLRKGAPGNVTFLGRVPESEAVRRMEECRAFVFAAEEDFGIVPVEAQAAGTPVIALGRGGALETVIDGTTGVFFAEHTVEAFQAAVLRLESLRLDRAAIRANALRFGPERFKAQMDRILAEAVQGVRR